MEKMKLVMVVRGCYRLMKERTSIEKLLFSLDCEIELQASIYTG